MEKKVDILTPGKFHHFDLAFQLNRFNLLNNIWTGYPKFKFKNINDKLLFSKIKSSGYEQILIFLLQKIFKDKDFSLINKLNELKIFKLNKKIIKNSKKSNILIGSSGLSLDAALHYKKNKKIFICDCGIGHAAYVNQIMQDEYRKWNLRSFKPNKKFISQSLKEYEIADLISVPSKFVYDSFIANGVVAEKLFLNPYGTNTKNFYPITINKNQNEFNVLFIGNVSLRKGFLYLLKAFDKLNYSKKKLTVIGPIQKEIKSILNNFNLNKVNFLGPIPNIKLNHFLNCADVLVHPSIMEGFSIALIEAYSTGIPIIATKNTGAENLINFSKSCYLVNPFSHAEILDKLNLLIDLKSNMESEKKITPLKRELIDWNTYGDNWQKKINSLVI